VSDDLKEAAPNDAKDGGQGLAETIKTPAKKPQRTVLEVMVSQPFCAALTILTTVMVAWIAANVQRSITDQTVSKDYVALSIEILKLEPKNGPDPLRDYAIELLAAKSPITISEAAKAQLRSQRLVVDPGPVKAVEVSGVHASATTVPSLAIPSTTP
jgi:hypothetical protein